MNHHPQQIIRDFTQGDVRRQLIAFSLPLFLSHLLQIAYNMADMVIIGQVMGKVGLSAISVGGDIYSCITFVAMGFANAGQILLSQFIGAGKRDQLDRFMATIFTFFLGFALTVSIAGLFFLEEILQLMNTPPEAYAEALAYARVSLAGIVFIDMYNAVSAVLRGMGDAKHPFYFIGFAALLNIVLDLVFVPLLGMGAGGAALATVLSQGLSCGLGFAFLLRHRGEYHLTLSPRLFFTWDRQLMGLLVSLGFPMALKNASVQLTKMFVNAWINAFGVAVSAFAGIGHKLNSALNMLSNSVNTAGASMIGQNIGARKYERVRRIMAETFKFMSVLACLFATTVYFFPDQIFGLFTADPEVLRIGREYVPIAILLALGCDARSGSNALLNGSGNPHINLAVALLDGIVLRLGFSIFFGFYCHMGYFGLWLGDAVAGFTPFVICLFFYRSGAWKKAAVHR